MKTAAIRREKHTRFDFPCAGDRIAMMCVSGILLNVVYFAPVRVDRVVKVGKGDSFTYKRKLVTLCGPPHGVWWVQQIVSLIRNQSQLPVLD